MPDTSDLKSQMLAEMHTAGCVDDTLLTKRARKMGLRPKDIDVVVEELGWYMNDEVKGKPKGRWFWVVRDTDAHAKSLTPTTRRDS